MKESLTFQHNPMQIKRKAADNCMECSAKYSLFGGQHICKRCYRSVCSDCSGTKTLIWKDNFKQQTHRLSKLCRVEFDAIRSYVKTQGLVFASDSDLARKWKKSIPPVEENYRHAKKGVEFNEELLNQLWNSLTYSMKDFVGSVLGDNPQGKLAGVQKEMKYVLNELNSRTEIRIQTAAPICLLLLCYSTPNTTIQLGTFLINQLRKSQTERQSINDTLKDLSCNSSEIKGMDEYINQKMRKSISILGMNVLESTLVQTVLQDMFQTPESIILMYSSLLGTEKKIVMEKDKDKNLIDVTLLRDGNVQEIKKSYNRLRNKAIKKRERKNSKKDNQDNQSEVVEKPQGREKVEQRKSEMNQVLGSISRIESVESPVRSKQIIKSQSFLEEIQKPKFVSQPPAIINRTISTGNEMGIREFGDEWKQTQKRRKFEKTGSYMDLGLDFQIQLRQMKSLGMETIVSSKETRRVHRIYQPFEYDFQGRDGQEQGLIHSMGDMGGSMSNSKVQSEYYVSETSPAKQREEIESKNNSMISSPVKQTSTSILKQSSHTPNSKLDIPAPNQLNSSKQPYPKQPSQRSIEQRSISQKSILVKAKDQPKQPSRTQTQLQQQAMILKEKVKFYERVLPQKQSLILEYRNKEKEKTSEGRYKEESPEIQRYRLESKNLQERILRLEIENKKLEKEKNKLESETVLNRSSVPTNRETSPETEMNVSVYSSSKTVGRDGKSSIESASQLKKELKLLEFTLKQKNEYIQTTVIQNKRLLKEFQDYKREQNRRVQLIREEYQNKMADLQLQRTKAKYQNQRLMKKLQEMSFNILSLQAQLFDENRKQFNYQ